jgi:hypothetical protein
MADNTSNVSVNDVSDIRIANPQTSPLQPLLLPIRGEKRFIPEDPLSLIGEAFRTTSMLGQTTTSGAPSSDFFVTAAKAEFTDYVMVRIPHRGVDPATGNPDPRYTATYRFLISPQTAQVSRNTEDSQTFARGGWQFGLWGEGLISVSLSGHTPGYYWSKGLTDEYAYFSESWRNLQQLIIVFENNGYWFEGEEANEGPLAPGFTRRRIKKHQDIQLIVGNYVWYGMFDTLTVNLDAEHPFRAEFSLSFLAWKERFRNTSPYAQWGIQNNVERGHAYGASSYPAAETVPTQNKAGQLTILPLSVQQNQANLTALSPAVKSDQSIQYYMGAEVCSSTPNLGLFNPGSVFGGS